MQKISLIETSADDLRIKPFEDILKSWVPKDFVNDFHGNRIIDHPQYNKLQILLMIFENREIIGGAILGNEVSLNEFSDKKKIQKILEYMRLQIPNFSYFCIKNNFRNNGFGSCFLEQMKKKHPKSWLSANDNLLSFYKRNNYEISIPRLSEEDSSLLISNKTL